MNMKAWYESKIVWVNAITTVVLAAGVLLEQSLIPVVAVPYILGGVAILNVVLRVWFTDTEIG